ncbi:FkbM family methyltransferase [Paragemmobacter ruber]|uniref:FkbM family methyltransferase n=1 Tax=Paragemmobacter ruber TaxID=1985673 RepID=A0ABW9Y8S8_9RHOB|nr:FkbM family methyltransferase [Rhodobacter ruber]NBE08934.1 FkbM family methyltransferase [Rhodobacter ruber]
MRPTNADGSTADGGLCQSLPGITVRNVIWGEPIFFNVTNPRDAIQKHHRAGRFYEEEELEIIRAACPPGAVFADIGANIGNHSLYVAKFLYPKKVICFEPNPVAIQHLRANLGLNGVLGICDLSHLGYGLSDVAAEGLHIDAPSRNLGGGRMVEGAGELRVVCGDELLHGEAPTFLKIDVEGMEIRVLKGLVETIAAHKPTIFIEVDNENREAFLAWVETNGYSVKSRYRRYRANENFLIIPRRSKRRKDASADQPADKP